MINVLDLIDHLGQCYDAENERYELAGVQFDVTTGNVAQDTKEYGRNVKDTEFMNTTQESSQVNTLNQVQF